MLINKMSKIDTLFTSDDKINITFLLLNNKINKYNYLIPNKNINIIKTFDKIFINYFNIKPLFNYDIYNINIENSDINYRNKFPSIITFTNQFNIHIDSINNIDKDINFSVSPINSFYSKLIYDITKKCNICNSLNDIKNIDLPFNEIFTDLKINFSNFNYNYSLPDYNKSNLKKYLDFIKNKIKILKNNTDNLNFNNYLKNPNDDIDTVNSTEYPNDLNHFSDEIKQFFECIYNFISPTIYKQIKLMIELINNNNGIDYQNLIVNYDPSKKDEQLNKLQRRYNELFTTYNPEQDNKDQRTNYINKIYNQLLNIIKSIKTIYETKYHFIYNLICSDKFDNICTLINNILEPVDKITNNKHIIIQLPFNDNTNLYYLYFDNNNKEYQLYNINIFNNYQIQLLTTDKIKICNILIYTAMYINIGTHDSYNKYFDSILNYVKNENSNLKNINDILNQKIKIQYENISPNICNILLSSLLFLYLNNIQDDNLYKSDNSLKIPNILYIFISYCYQFLCEIDDNFKDSILKINNDNYLSYYNYIPAILNEIYKSYVKFYDDNLFNSIFNNITNKNLLKSNKKEDIFLSIQKYNENINILYNEIKKTYNIDKLIENNIYNKLIVSINNTKNKDKSNNNLINKFSESKYLSDIGYLYKPQIYRIMHDNINIIQQKINNNENIDLKDYYFNTIDTESNKNILINVYNNKVKNNIEFSNYIIKFITTNSKNWYINYKNNKYIKYYNLDNSFIPFSYEYDQLIDIISMTQIKVYNKLTNNILDFNKIIDILYNIYKIDRKLTFNEQLIKIQLLFINILNINDIDETYKNEINFIKDNIIEYSKIFIHRMISLFHYLNINMIDKIYNAIKDYLILNYLSTFYLYQILCIINIIENKILIYDKQYIKFEIKENLTEFNNLNYGINIMNKFYEIINKCEKYPTDYKDVKQYYNTIKNDINSFNKCYNYFVLLKLINPVYNQNMLNSNSLENNLYLLLDNNKFYYQNNSRKTINDSIKNYIDNLKDYLNSFITNKFKVEYKQDINQLTKKSINNNDIPFLITSLKNDHKYIFEPIINYIITDKLQVKDINSDNAKELINIFKNKFYFKNSYKKSINNFTIEIKNNNIIFNDKNINEQIQQILEFLKQIFIKFYNSFDNLDDNIINDIQNDIKNNDIFKDKQELFNDYLDFIRKLIIFNKINDDNKQIITRLQILECINITQMSYLKIKPLNPTIINLKYELEYYINNKLLNQQVNNQDFTKSILYFKSYLFNCFNIFTQIYQSFMNETDLNHIIKYDFINILSLINSKEDFNKYFDNNDYNKYHILYKYYNTTNDNIAYNQIIEHIFYNFMYSLFNNNKILIENNNIINELKELYINIINEDIEYKNYYYYQIPLLLNNQTPYMILSNFKKLNPQKYEQLRDIFNDNLKYYKINIKNNQTHYLILLVLYNLGLLTDDEILIKKDTIDYLLNNIYKLENDKVSYDIQLLLKNIFDDNNNYKISYILPYTNNINITHKAFINYINKTDTYNNLIEDINKNIQLNNPIVNYYSSSNYIKYSNNKICFNYNNKEYEYNNQINSNVIFNNITYNNIDCILFKNEDNDIFIEFKNKLVYSNDKNVNNCLFHLKKYDGIIKIPDDYKLVDSSSSDKSESKADEPSFVPDPPPPPPAPSAPNPPLPPPAPPAPDPPLPPPAPPAPNPPLPPPAPSAPPAPPAPPTGGDSSTAPPPLPPPAPPAPNPPPPPPAPPAPNPPLPPPAPPAPNPPSQQPSSSALSALKLSPSILTSNYICDYILIDGIKYEIINDQNIKYISFYDSINSSIILTNNNKYYLLYFNFKSQTSSIKNIGYYNIKNYDNKVNTYDKYIKYMMIKDRNNIQFNNFVLIELSYNLLSIVSENQDLYDNIFKVLNNLNKDSSNILNNISYKPENKNIISYINGNIHIQKYNKNIKFLLDNDIILKKLQSFKKINDKINELLINYYDNHINKNETEFITNDELQNINSLLIKNILIDNVDNEILNQINQYVNKYKLKEFKLSDNYNNIIILNYFNIIFISFNEYLDNKEIVFTDINPIINLELTIDNVNQLKNTILNNINNKYIELINNYKKYINLSYYDFIKNNIIDYYILLYCYIFINDIYEKFISNINQPIYNSFDDLSNIIKYNCNKFNEFYNNLISLKNKNINKINDTNNIPIIGCPTISSDKFIIKNIPEYSNIKNNSILNKNIKTFPELNIIRPGASTSISNKMLEKPYNNITNILPYIKYLYYTNKKQIYDRIKYDSNNKIYTINNRKYKYNEILNSNNQFELIDEINTNSFNNEQKIYDIFNILLFIIFKWLDNDINIYYNNILLSIEDAYYNLSSYKYIQNYTINTFNKNDNLIIQMALNQLYNILIDYFKFCFENDLFDMDKLINYLNNDNQYKINLIKNDKYDLSENLSILLKNNNNYYILYQLINNNNINYYLEYYNINNTHINNNLIRISKPIYTNNLLNINIKNITYDMEIISSINIDEYIIKKILPSKELDINQDINNIFKNDLKDNDNIYYKDMQIYMFEIFFGHFIRKEQIELINNIYNNLLDNKKEYHIKNLFMGGGKSSVLTPVLTQLIELHNMPFIVIVPEHLLKDTITPLLKYRPLYRRNLRFINNINDVYSLVIDPRYNYVLSDSQFKYWKLLMHKYGKDPDIILRQFYILIDEIDSILDPIKSNFNKINKINEIKDYIKNKKGILYNIYLKELFKLRKISNNNLNINLNINIFDNQLYDSYKFISSLEYGINYGFSTYESHGNDFIGVPYEHANNPIKNSYYTVLTHTIIATLLSYVNVYDKKRYIDINKYLLLNNNKFKINDNTLIKMKLDEIKNEFINNYNIYFEYIINNLIEYINETILYDNISSVEIIGKNVSLYKTAYSGTVNFNLPSFHNINIKSNNGNNNTFQLYDKINENNLILSSLRLTQINNKYEFIDIDKDENSFNKIYIGLLGINNIKEHSIFYYNNINDIIFNKTSKKECLIQNCCDNARIPDLNKFKSIFDLISYKNKGVLKYNALVDAGGFFKSFNTINVVQLLYNNINKDIKDIKDQFKIIYIDIKGYKYIYYKHSLSDKDGLSIIFKYNNDESNKYFYYYDNQHIVGTDIQQPTNMFGLLTMTYFNNYTNIAQAAFRIRDLGEKRKIDYILDVNVQNTDKTKIMYNNFISNILNIIDLKLKDDSKLYLQYLYILYYLHLTDKNIQNMKLKYLFNQNVLYYYKLCNKNIYSLCYNKDLFLYLNKLINNKSYKIKEIKDINYYKYIFYYTPYSNNSIKSFIIKENNNFIYNDIYNNEVIKSLLNDPTYDILKNNKDEDIFDTSTEQSKDNDEDQDQDQTQQEFTVLEDKNKYNGIINNFSFNKNKNLIINKEIFTKYNTINNLYYYNNNNPSISVCVKCNVSLPKPDIKSSETSEETHTKTSSETHTDIPNYIKVSPNSLKVSSEVSPVYSSIPASYTSYSIPSFITSDKINNLSSDNVIIKNNDLDYIFNNINTNNSTEYNIINNILASIKNTNNKSNIKSMLILNDAINDNKLQILESIIMTNKYIKETFNLSLDIYNIFILSIILKYIQLSNDIIQLLINNIKNIHIINNNTYIIKNINNTILYINYILHDININNKIFTKTLNKELFNIVNSIFNINKIKISNDINRNDIIQIIKNIIDNNIIPGIDIVNKIINKENIKNDIIEYKYNQITSDVINNIDKYILSLYYIKSELFINKDFNTILKNQIKIIALCNNYEPFIYSYQFNNQLINKYIKFIINKKENLSNNNNYL